MLKKNVFDLLRFYSSTIFILVLLNFPTAVYADDPGIHKARLLQQNDSLYIFEVDVAQKWVWAIKDPVFPTRFNVSPPQYINKGTWTVIRVQITTSEHPLDSNDTIFLPWSRNGADLTIVLKDNTFYKGLFIRDIEGITIPLKRLLPIQVDNTKLCVAHIKTAFSYVYYSLCFVLLALVTVVYFDKKKRKTIYSIFLLSQGFGLILAVWNVPGPGMVFTTLLFLVYTVLLCFNGIKNIYATGHTVVFSLLGLLLSLSYFEELKILSLDIDQKTVVQFVFLATFNIVLSLLLLVSDNLKKVYFKRLNLSQLFYYGIGSLAVFALLLIFSNTVIRGNLDILNLQQSAYLKQNATLRTNSKPLQNNKPVGKAELTTPLMSFLSIEPYEVRHEILINARTAIKLLGVDDSGKSGIPLNSLAPVKAGIHQYLKHFCKLQIDGELNVPSIVNVDFVTLSTSGVMLRDAPVRESLDSGIIGVTMVHEIDKYPSKVKVNWEIFSDAVSALETTSIDPFVTHTSVLTKNAPVYIWENQLFSISNNAINSVAVKERKLPYFSYILLLVSLCYILYKKHSKQSINQKLCALLFAICFVSFPFLRFHLNIPYLSQLTPSKVQTKAIIEKLLTNVYKSFEVRNESKVYDRLALSVTGDKLTDIYLENRKSLEFENRGGARANIDDVIIKFVGEVKRVEHNTFLVRAEWMANGAVGHFGHTHYRRNWYNALITFTIEEHTWKIKNIELVEEKRLL